MDSGSYNHVHRGTAPLSAVTPTAAASTYKTNMNRTKTRKWVEAKVQSYDGDDWGNEYDDYDNDDDSEQHDIHEPNTQPEPLPAVRLAGPRQLGQTGHHQLPSRTFPSSAGSHSFNPLSLRSSGSGSGSDGPLLRHAQTQPTVASTSSPSTTELSYPATISAKSYDSSKETGGEKEPELLSAESRLQNPDDIVCRTVGASSSGQSYGQHRRMSFESHDDALGLARVAELYPASVAGPRMENTTNDFLEGLWPAQAPALHESIVHTSGLSIFPFEAGNEEVKAETVKDRRFSTSPQLPKLMDVSRFGDDIPSGSGHDGSQTSTNRAFPLQEPNSQLNESRTTTATSDRVGNQTPSILEGNTGVGEKSRATEEIAIRPQLPGSLVLGNSTNSTLSKQPTPLAKRDAWNAISTTSGQKASISLMESHTELSSVQSATSLEGVSLSVDMSNANEANKSVAEQRADAIVASEASVTRSHCQTPQSIQHSEVTNWHAHTSPIVPPAVSHSPSPLMPASPKIHPPSSVSTANPEITPTAPLDPGRVDASQPEYHYLPPLIHQRMLTTSTIETTSSEKESDKLREEIIKSLNTAPISPDLNGLPNQGDSNLGPTIHNITRESTYLAGVYDDYLSSSPDDEKILQGQSLTVQPSTNMSPNQSAEAEAKEPVSGCQHDSIQSSSPRPVEDHGLENMTRARRFSWQEALEEATENSAESKPAVCSPVRSQEDTDTKLDITSTTKMSEGLFAEAGWTDAISHQLSQVGSPMPGDTSSTVHELASPISLTAAKGPQAASDEPNPLHISLVDEKEKVLIGDAQSATSNLSDQHPALMLTTGQETHALSVGPVSGVLAFQSFPTPTPFREIINFGTPEERIRKFDETREQFYAMDSGLQDWLAYLQSQPEHTNIVMPSNNNDLSSMAGAHTASAGTPSTLQSSHKAGGAPGLHQRRKSIGHVQQLLAGQSIALGASGNQMGTKSKELLHAAGAFGNKGVKSGMKLFNKGKSKFRERTGGDKAFF
ncbi:hypothetical protein GGS21DRAFT_528714 [Xylaria nigripes]|nr:hypothetical protein GGS21DRAFT_528714 [Xylaria nigripes]